MLKVLYQKLRLKCKGSLNHNNYSNLSKLQIGKVGKLDSIGKHIVQGIPVLSIFALVGIVVFSVNMQNHSLTCSAAGDVCPDGLPQPTTLCEQEGYIWQQQTNHCWECVPDPNYVVPPSASLTIGGAGETEQVPAGRGATTYRSHTVRVAANNVSNYGLVITGPSSLTSPSDSTVITGISNQTGLEMDSSNAYDDTWGYGWGDTNTDNANLTYRTLSTTGTDILTVNGTNDKPVLVNRAVDFTKKLVFAVKFSEDATPGRYYANVTLSLTATPSTLTTYSITYSGNGNTSGTVPAKQSIDLYDTTSYNGFTAAANTGNLTKTGYNFLGWAESSSATSAQYAVGDTIPLTQSKPEITLYAVWEKEGPNVTGFGGIKKMQDMTPAVCKSVSVNTTGQLYDIRDDSVYTVARLIDGNCWMTQNLRLTKEGMAAKGYDQLTSSDSDVTSNYVLPATLKSASGAFLDTSTGAQIYYVNNTTYGAYYSWKAATVASSTDSNSNALSSVCPKNWKLPTGGTETSQFYKLYEAAGFGDANGSTKMKQSPYNFVYAGYVSRGNAVVGSEGNFWSSHYAGTNIANRLFFNDSLTNPSTGHSKIGHGLSVRCIAAVE